jgi:hypothetical protein
MFYSQTCLHLLAGKNQLNTFFLKKNQPLTQIELTHKLLQVGRINRRQEGHEECWNHERTGT